MKIKSITADYFETEDGTKVYHTTPLDVVPTVEEFQEIYDRAENFFKEQQDGQTNIS